MKTGHLIKILVIFISFLIFSFLYLEFFRIGE